MKEYIAQPNYEHELTELTEPGKLCGPPGIFVKKYDCARAIVEAREEGQREGIEKAKVVFLNEHNSTGATAWNLVCIIKTLDALLDAKEAGK